MEAATTERAGQEGVDVPEPGPQTRGPHPLSGYYVVLAAGAAVDTVERVSGRASASGDNGDDEVPEQLTYEGQYQAPNGADAKRQCLAQYPDLAEAVNGEGLWLVAVPARSYEPRLAREKQRDPVIEGL